MSANSLGCSPTEWEARKALAAVYRVFDYMGWTELIYNHISLRVPDQTGQFLLNPFGLHYSEVCASNLVKVDVFGNLITSQNGASAKYRINPAGFVPHATIHSHIERAHCVMHTHTTAGMAIACYEKGLSMNNFYAAQLCNRVAYHDFEGITIHGDEGPRLLRSLGDKPAVILRNHGLLSWGETLASTFAVLWTLQRACEVQVATQSLGNSIPISQAIQQKCAQDSLLFSPEHGAGEDVLNALIRLVDKQDTSYRE